LFFVALAVDEYFEIHEYVNTLIKEVLREDNFLGYLAHTSWVFPLAFIILLVFGLFVLKIVKEPCWEIRRFLWCGLASFFLVIVFEFLGAVSYGNDIYVLFVGIEEGLEMIGVSFFLLAVVMGNQTRYDRVRKRK
jgi:hypothetical protein